MGTFLPLLFVLALAVSIARWFTPAEWAAGTRRVLRGIPAALFVALVLMAVFAFASTTGTYQAFAEATTGRGDR